MPKLTCGEVRNGKSPLKTNLIRDHNSPDQKDFFLAFGYFSGLYPSEIPRLRSGESSLALPTLASSPNFRYRNIVGEYTRYTMKGPGRSPAPLAKSVVQLLSRRIFITGWLDERGQPNSAVMNEGPKG